MLRLILLGVGFVGGYLYGSERAREEARRRLATAPEPVRRATERVSSAIATAPLPDSVKQMASRATVGAQSAVEQAANVASPTPEVARPSPAEVSGRPAEQLPCIEPESRLPTSS